MTDQPDDKKKRLKKLQTRQPPGTVRVLYVEDAAVIRDTITQLLEMSGYEVAYAKNGREGVEKTIEWQPHVVLMDLRMPIMDGYEAINQIKTHPQTEHIPIFVISAWSSKKERTQAKLAGADAFFVKPPSLDSLVEAIEKAVAASRKDK